MIIYCCGAMRSGSTLLFTLVYALVKSELKKTRCYSVRIDSLEELEEQLLRYNLAKQNDKKLTLIVNGTFSKNIYSTLPSQDTVFISSLRCVEDCLGSAKLRWGYRWTNSETELKEVLRNLHLTMEGIKEVADGCALVMDYEQLFGLTYICLRKISNFLGYADRSDNYYISLCEKVKYANNSVSSSKVLKIFRNIRSSNFYALLSDLSKKILPYRIHKKIGYFVKTKVLKKYSTDSYIGPNHISKNGGVPGASAKALTLDEKNFFAREINDLNKIKLDLISKHGV